MINWDNWGAAIPSKENAEILSIYIAEYTRICSPVDLYAPTVMTAVDTRNHFPIEVSKLLDFRGSRSGKFR